MKFGKNLLRVIELSDAEWGPYWMDYKLLKKKINEIVEETNKANNIDGITDTSSDSSSRNIANNKSEVEFFRLLRKELKKTSDFYSSAEDIYKIREKRTARAKKCPRLHTHTPVHTYTHTHSMSYSNSITCYWLLYIYT
jgi:hypothetical protein